MPLSVGEQFTVFFLLLSPRSTLRAVLEGTHDTRGGAPPGKALDAGKLKDRAEKALKELGIAENHFDATLKLDLLFDAHAPNNVTLDNTKIAEALPVQGYQGICPKRDQEKAILAGIKSQMG